MEDQMVRRIADDRGVIIGWLVRIMVILALLATIVYEGGTVLLANFSASDAASAAAGEANFVFRDTRDYRSAEQAARDEVAKHTGVTYKSFQIDTVARTVSVEVHKEAHTLFMQRIRAFRKYTSIDAKETKPFPSV